MSVELSWLTAVSWHGEVVWKLPKSCTVKNERLRATAEHALNQELKDINNCKTFFCSSGVKEALWNAANPFGASISFIGYGKHLKWNINLQVMVSPENANFCLFTNVKCSLRTFKKMPAFKRFNKSCFGKPKVFETP